MERSQEEKAATQESACGGARPTGWPGAQRSHKAREQGEWPQGRTGQKSQEDDRGSPQFPPPTSRAPQESSSTVMAVIRARYGYLAIGLGDSGIRHGASALR